MAFVRLRYKLPDGNTSRLIERPVAAPLLDHAARPSGDTAFVTAVAAFGQKLRGDTRLGDLDYADIRRLAGTQDGYWRQEFLKLTELAEAGSPSANRPVATEDSRTLPVDVGDGVAYGGAMTTPLYDITVPVLIRSLGSLSAILTKGEAFAAEKGIDSRRIARRRLIEDMGS